MVKGTVIQFRRRRTGFTPRHFILDFGMKNKEEALSLAGKDVEWKSPAGLIIKGKIASSHGNKGMVRAIFEKGLPGQAITTEVEMKGEINVKKEAKPKVKTKEEKTK